MLRVCAVLALLDRTLSLSPPTDAPVVFASFGMVTDLHYGDKDAAGTRFYRDSLPKLQEAISIFNSYNTSSPGATALDFVVELGDFKDKDPNNDVNNTLGYLDVIEAAFSGFVGSRFHVLGNHDVDVLSQPQVLQHITNVPDHAHEASFSFDVPKSASSTGLHFVVLNGDFAADGTPWDSLDTNPQFQWTDPWLDNTQLQWLKADLAAARAEDLKTIVFVHYRLDGGLTNATNTSWIHDCTLDNAAAVRTILEAENVARNGSVLATFSGHDHTPNPPLSVSNGLLYFTHASMVEGPYPAHNAFSVVQIMSDCSIVVSGHGDAFSYTHPGPLGCSLF